MENKNTIIALVLMLIVWTGFTYIFPPVENVPEKINVEVANEPVEVEKTVVIPAQPTSFVNNNVEKIITVENELFVAKFSTVGASLIDFELKKYKKENTVDSPLVSMMSMDNDLKSMTLTGTGDFSLSDSLVFHTESPLTLSVVDQGTLVFDLDLGNGLILEKVFSFKSDAYLFEMSLNFYNKAARSVSGTVSLHMNTYWTDSMEGNRLEFVGPVSYIADELLTVDVSDLAESKESYRGGFSWTGFETKYFISSILSQADGFSDIQLEKGTNVVTNTVTTNTLQLVPGSTKNITANVYYGPKEINILKSVGSQLSAAVDFGFFKIIAKPLHSVLNFFYSYIGNYGFSIILLTIILKLLFWPLTQKSYVSMKAMQTLQPEMKKLRDKHGSDRETLNRKMMELYKEHRVNPLGGCLPMLVQIPVFFALYKVLLDTIELRHAPFALWLTDLSVKDPYYITPIVMGATMFIQQKLTPSTMDPMQAKMMMAMPVVFTFLFLNFPSGLVIYWLVNNLLTIFQQYLIYRKPA